jgi:hypothetical protein
MRAVGVVSTACDSGVLDDELDAPGACATSAGAPTTPPTSNATAAAAIGTIRDREGIFRLNTIRFRRSHRV